MLFKTHLAFSIAVYFLILKFFDVPDPLFFLIFILFSTAFVDLDSRNSFIGKSILNRPLQFFTKHRGILHSLLFAVLSSLIIAAFNHWAGFGFLVGYISHLFLDSLTVSGVSLFYPVFKFKIKGFVRSGKILEQVLFVLLFLTNIFIVVKLFLNSSFWNI